MKIRTNDLKQAQFDSYMVNSGIADKRRYIESENTKDPWERNNAGFLDRSIRLPADFTYRPAATPKILIDVEKITRRLDVQASSVIDFPLEMIQSSGGVKAANLQGNLRFW
jgi:hypothetical protein